MADGAVSDGAVSDSVMSERPPADLLADLLDDLLRSDDAERGRRYPGTVPRQPVHTVYVPADRFGVTTVRDWGAQALAVLSEHGPLPGFDEDVHASVRAKLARQPIEDLRIDFEDGYGHHDDEDERVHAAAVAVRAVAARGELPAGYGLRIKSFEGATRRRGLRTLEMFLDCVLATGPLPPGFRVTLPKVTSVRQVEAMAVVCDTLENRLGLARLPVELQIETAQAVLGADGRALVAPMLHAAGGRCIGLHYGTYDYSTALGVGPAGQSMEHPVADHATAVMQVAAAGTGAVVSHGSTNVLPVGARADVRSAWELHARLVRRSLERGIYQGWDLHPAQLPTRYAATFAFYREGLAAAGRRLRAYLAGAESGVLDEPATARSLAGFLLRAVRCGAVSEHSAAEQCGLYMTELERLV